MKTKPTKLDDASPSARRFPPPQPPDADEPARPRLHGDSYSEPTVAPEPVGTASTHEPQGDRRPEEPSERAAGDAERLEDESGS